jgi:4-amino-4-deoxy-L-arabinose transferase-like glycosyltransferase
MNANPTHPRLPLRRFVARIFYSLDINKTIPAAESKVEKYAPLMFIIGVVLLCTLPFLNKAYSIDDPLFIWSAKHIQQDPLNPYGFNVNWYRQIMPMSYVTKNPPITSYFIAAFASLGGWGESFIHSLFLLPAIAVAVGTYIFAQRYCQHPLHATLAGILTPVFLVSSLTVMSDMMMLAFWIAAVNFWIKGLEKNDTTAFILSGLLISFSALTKYFGIMLIPLLLIFTLYRERRLRFHLVYFLIPLFILLLYHWGAEYLYGRGLFFDAAEQAITQKSYMSNFLSSKMFVNFAFIGGCLGSLLFFAFTLWKRTFLLLGLLIICGGTYHLSHLTTLGAFIFPLVKSDRIILSVQLSIWMLVGLSIVILALQDFYHHRGSDSLLLFLWIIGTFLFAGFINWTTNGRSILPMVIPTGILITRKLEHLILMRKPQKSYIFIIPFVLSAILSVTIAWADCIFANTARSAATIIYHTYGDTTHSIYFQGHWGYQYYMEEHGARAVDISYRQFKPGDIIADPATNTNLRFIPRKWVTVVDSIKIVSPLCAATTNYELGAGFYADAFGPLPFAFGFIQPEVFTVYLFHQYTPLEPR